jgi:CRISPR-associated endonuclease/helicase Cas3
MLGRADFGRFYEALHRVRPFPWQQALLERIWEGGHWPKVIDLPTGAGKTSCIDIALYGMAAGRADWRRIFFVVDRRIIVSDVAERARKIEARLREPKEEILHEVATALRMMGGGMGLGVCEMRGGVYQDKSWVSNPLQPMIIASTVDQVGSRLLFRGYGVSERTAPIHAAMVACDSLILLDEAHCSRAFGQTLKAVQRYQGWRAEAVGSGLRVVEMTATPSVEVEENERFRLTAADESEAETPALARRLRSAKPTKLRLVKKGKDSIITALADEAVELGKRGVTGVIVNRVKTARDVFEELCKREGPDSVLLLIGRMRPLDATAVHEALRPIHTGSNREKASVRYVVSTQCLEVGADLDFDGLVTECASIDALQQRFGRLDRAGRLQGSAQGRILCAEADAESKDDDPIYGDRLKKTWKWLGEIARDEGVDFGLRPSCDLPNVAERLSQLSVETQRELRRIGEEACILLPAHLDALSQTAPQPHVDPDVSVFLHGPVDGKADVQVIWRVEVGLAEVEARIESLSSSDESAGNQVRDKQWLEKLIRAFALCPPSSVEALPARIWDVRAWLRDEAFDAPDADIEGLEIELREERRPKRSIWPPVLRWRGKESGLVRDPGEIRPGDTVIVDVSRTDNLSRLGYIPNTGLVMGEGKVLAVRDYGDRAAEKKGEPRRRFVEELIPEAGGELARTLLSRFRNEDADLKFMKEEIKALPPEAAGADGVAWLREAVETASRVDRYFGGYLLRGPRKRQTSREDWQAAFEEDDGDDIWSFGSTQSLRGHTELVKRHAGNLASKLAPHFANVYRQAAEWHDVGKADMRFQTMLCNGDRLKAEMLPEAQLLAKSEFRGYERGDLPAGFRHEMASMEFAAEFGQFEEERELALHLIASHHGHARPFAPYIADVEAREIHYAGHTLRQGGSERTVELGLGCGERFWELQRRFGWWGVAYLESIFRLADWRASRETGTEASDATQGD